MRAQHNKRCDITSAVHGKKPHIERARFCQTVYALTQSLKHNTTQKELLVVYGVQKK